MISSIFFVDQGDTFTHILQGSLKVADTGESYQF